MKFQRSNKYTKKIINNVIPILIATTILEGCSDSDMLFDDAPQSSTLDIIQTEGIINDSSDDNYDNETFDEDYLINKFLPLSEDEIEEAINTLCIKNAVEYENIGCYCTAIFENSLGEKKVMLVKTIKYDFGNDSYNEVIDAFSKITIFKTTVDDSQPYDVDINGVYDCHPFLEGMNLILFDVLPEFYNFCISEGTPCEYMDNILYIDGDSADIYTSDLQIARLYVASLPEKFRVKGVDLGLAYDEDEKVYKLG